MATDRSDDALMERADDDPMELSRHRMMRRAGFSLAVLAVVLAVLAVVADLTIGHARASARSSPTGGPDQSGVNAAIGVAREAATDAFTEDYRHLDTDFSRVAALGTGGFKTEFTQQAQAVQSQLVTAQAVSTGTVRAIGVSKVSSDGKTVTLLVAIDQTVTDKSAPKGQTVYYRVELTMAKQPSGAWLVSVLQPV